MQDLIGQALAIGRGALRYRWAAIGATWVICALGWALVELMPDSYESRAKVYVDTESVLRPLLQGLAVNSGDANNQLNMVRAFVMSRPNLERVARVTGLADRAEDRLALEDLLASLPRSIGLIQTGPENNFELTYRDRDRAMAQRVVEAMLASFVKDSSSLKTQDTTSAQRFLEQQIAEYERRLRAAETRLAEFKQRNVGLMPGEGGDYYARLQTELTKLEALEAKYRQATDRRTELQRQLEGEEPTFGLVSSPKDSRSGPIDAQIADLKRQLDALLVQYTDKHPNAITLREQIAQLEARKRSGITTADARPTTTDPSAVALRALDVNPVYQSMKIALSQTEVELADLKSQSAQQRGIVADLRSRVDTMPRVEADLAQLNRDYEVNRAQYTALVQRLESARLSDDARKSSDEVKFRVIEPPMTPSLPVSPKRPLLLAFILVLALGVGGAAAVCLHLLHPVFPNRNMLRAATNLPILGAIGRVVTPPKQPFLRRESVWFAGATAALVLTFTGLLLWNALDIRLLALS